MLSLTKDSVIGTHRPLIANAPSRPVGNPRCRCGEPIEHVSGKVPKSYCSDRCRKAARREIARIERELAKAGGNPGHLGKETTEFPTPLRPAETSERGNPVADREAARTAASRSRKVRRYAGRRTLWQITNDRTCRGCGRTVMDPESGVILAQTAEGKSVVMGLLKCGKIWLCPVCSATIRHRRAEEITKAVVSWIQQGGTALMVTFTARHAASDELATLMDAIQGTRADEANGIKRKAGAYQRLITGGTWAGRPQRGVLGLREKLGYVGMIRATEITLGQANGWHPHIHAIVFIGGRTEGERGDKRITGTFKPQPGHRKALEEHFRAVWTNHLARVDRSFKPSDRHGVDFRELKTVQDAENTGEYIAKLQDGNQAISPANEVARGDNKEGRHGNVTPFQLLGRIGDLTGGADPEEVAGHGSKEWCLARWWEYETAVKGRRAIEWTRYLRPLLGITGDDTEEADMDALFEGEDMSKFRAGARIAESAWHKVAGRALDLAAVESAEGDGIELEKVAAVVTAAGGSWASVRLLTPGEVEQLWESTLTALASRRTMAAERRKAKVEQ